VEAGGNDVDDLDELIPMSRLATHFSSDLQIGFAQAAITTSQAFQRLWSIS